MSEQSLSTNPKSVRLSAGEIRKHLRKVFRGNHEASVLWQMSRMLNDPVEQAQDGGFHLKLIYLQLLVLAGLAAAAFCYFTFVK